VRGASAKLGLCSSRARAFSVNPPVVLDLTPQSSSLLQYFGDFSAVSGERVQKHARGDLISSNGHASEPELLCILLLSLR